MPDFDTINPQQDDDDVRPTADEETRRRERGVTDDGHTGGGGSLGHDQPEKVRRETPTRNTTDREDTPDRNATAWSSDPVMPSDDATLKTKI
jgi:hypothetical protein